MDIDVKEEEKKENEEAKSSSSSDDGSDSDSDSSDGGDTKQRGRNTDGEADDAALNEARAAILSNLVAPVQLSDQPPGDDEPVRSLFGERESKS